MSYRDPGAGARLAGRGDRPSQRVEAMPRFRPGADGWPNGHLLYVVRMS